LVTHAQLNKLYITKTFRQIVNF